MPQNDSPSISWWAPQMSGAPEGRPRGRAPLRPELDSGGVFFFCAGGDTF